MVFGSGWDSPVHAPSSYDYDKIDHVALPLRDAR